MSHHHRRTDQQLDVVMKDVQVRAADTSSLHSDAHLARTGMWFRDLGQADVPGTGLFLQ